MAKDDIRIAWHRFGLGPRLGETPPSDTKAWLERQVTAYDPAPPPIAAVAKSPAIAAEIFNLLAERQQARQEARLIGEARPMAANAVGPASRRHLTDAIGARGAAALSTDTPFAERLVHFWANHFAVSADKQRMIALTGWTVGGLGQGRAADPGRFVFARQVHEPGERRLLGKPFAAGEADQGAAMLDMLGTHPATARHIATKLARHFAGDTAPPAMVARLEAAFTRSGGDLPTVYRALIASPEVWVPQPVKFRSPWEWTIAVLRASGVNEFPGPALSGLQQQLGQPVWKPGSPAGWDDTDATWAAPDALMRRVEAAERLASRTQSATLDARALARDLFPGSTSPTAEAVARAESPPQALALLFASPDFMRR